MWIVRIALQRPYTEARIRDNAVAASERSLTLATNRYRGGVATYLEVITAQSAPLANERAGVNILARRMVVSVLLVRALGGGWNIAALPVAGPRCCNSATQEPCL